MYWSTILHGYILEWHVQSGLPLYSTRSLLLLVGDERSVEVTRAQNVKIVKGLKISRIWTSKFVHAWGHWPNAIQRFSLQFLVKVISEENCSSSNFGTPWFISFSLIGMLCVLWRSPQYCRDHSSRRKAGAILANWSNLRPRQIDNKARAINSLDPINMLNMHKVQTWATFKLRFKLELLTIYVGRHGYFFLISGKTFSYITNLTEGLNIWK